MQPPSTETVYDLFNAKIQFIVPTYQRAYVWDEEENWSPMWEDIAETASTYVTSGGGVTDRHFLGPIVLEQMPFPPGGIDKRRVIDGQQRLTTLQILLAAAELAVREVGAEDVAEEIAELTTNHGLAAKGELKLKVLPSRRDRASFVGVMERAPSADGDRINRAYTYFLDAARKWLTLGGPAGGRAEALLVCLTSLLYVVSINLDESDNAQVIFETLNARGTGLGALDLVKNAAFLDADKQGAATDTLYDKLWEPTFERDDYWLEETRQGREKRDRADWFLMHWLAMSLERVVRADKLFDTFRKEVLRRPSTAPASELIRTLCSDAKIMRNFDDFEPGTAEGLFFSRLQALDTTTMLPIALLLFRSEEVTSDRRLRALLALESWLVRRAIVKLTPKNYNRSITSLLGKIKANLGSADEALIQELRSSQAETARWPTDEELRARLERGDLYDYVNQARVRLLLEACERDLRGSSKTEPIEIPGGLSIEHALPKAWQEHWRLPPEQDTEETQMARQAHVNRIGNLTLVTQSLNSSMSNSPWMKDEGDEYSKRDELQSRSLLLINTLLCKNDRWDEDLIDARGHDFTERILRTWPGPTADFWN